MKNPPRAINQTLAAQVRSRREVPNSLHPGRSFTHPAFYLRWLGFGLDLPAGLVDNHQLVPFARSQGIPGGHWRQDLAFGAIGNVSVQSCGVVVGPLGRLNTFALGACDCGRVAIPLMYWLRACVRVLRNGLLACTSLLRASPGESRTLAAFLGHEK